MPCRLTGVLLCLLVSIAGWTQGESALLRTEEFKGKVELARMLGVDTLPDFKVQWEYYRRKLEERGDDETALRKTAVGKSEKICLTILTRRLAQHASAHVQAEEKQLMDSLYGAVRQGSDFEVLAAEYSDDASHGKPVWMPVTYLLKEWSTCLDALQQGEVSQPFLSPMGWHMLRWTERKSREERETEELHRLHLREEELYESLLVASLDKKYRKPVGFTEKELKTWFKENREVHGWNLPYYKGAVVHCRNKAEAKRIRKSLKKMDFDEWKALAENGLSENVQMECGLYRIGDNPCIDKLVFKCGSYEQQEELPYTFVLGKTLKKGLDDYRSIYDEVVKSYREAHKNDWYERLRQEESQKVKKTVNNGGS